MQLLLSHTAIEKIAEVMKQLVNMAGSQNNKLSKINLSLKSFDGALQNLEGDAYKLQRQNERAIEDLEDEQMCSVAQSEEALDDLCEVKDCITEIQETLDRIEGFVHPCEGPGWIEVVNITYFGENAQPCPIPWELAGPGCGRFQPAPNMPVFLGVPFPVGNGVLYNEVCGRIHGFQSSSVAAFIATTDTINDPYVDGISVTHDDGSGNPVHIWTFAASSLEAPTDDTTNAVECPCDGGTDPPTFVGQNYFCESGSVVLDDLLWDGEDCVSEVCCTRANPPYFNAYLNSPTTAPIYVTMILNDQNADITITHIELYVRFVPSLP